MITNIQPLFASGLLGLNLKDFIVQLISFAIVVIVLIKWAVNPIVKVLNNRKELIENGVKLGQEMEMAKSKLEQEIANELHKARTEADRIISESQQEGRKLIKAAEEDAKSKAASLIAKAGDQIGQDMIMARKRLEKDIVSLVSNATEAIIGEKVDAKKDSELIDKTFKAREAE